MGAKRTLAATYAKISFVPVATDSSLMVRNFANGAICALLTLVPSVA